jgi:hypothetical protein
MDDPTLTVAPQRGGVGTFLVKAIGVLMILVLAVLIGLWGVQRYVASRLAPDPVTVASASLEGLREQNRLSAFAARYVSVTTSKRSVMGFSTQKTLLMPGSVRYEVDLGRLAPRDVAWDAGTKTLAVRLPPVEVDGPQIDLTQIREYSSGGVLTTFTDVEAQLDQVNRREGQAELLRQARAPAMIRLARDATRRAVERSFALPLRAAGVEAKVVVHFADEPVANDERWDVSRSLEEVLGNRS